MTKKVFISHSSKNINTCRMVVGFLRQAGIREDQIFCTSIPELGIHGTDFPEEIVHNIESSAFNIIILSSEYANSIPCQNEAGIIWFLHKSKKAIPMFCLVDMYCSVLSLKGFVNGNTCHFHPLNKEKKIQSMTDLCESARRALGIKRKYRLLF